MSVQYEEYESREVAQAKERGAAYEAARRSAAEQQIRERQKAAAIRQNGRVQKTESQKKQAMTGQTDEYVKNAVQQAVNRRRVQRVLADLGLGASGYRQAAARDVATQKAMKDAVLSAEQTAAVEKLSADLAAWIAEQQAKEAEKSADLRASAQTDAIRKKESIYSAAQKQAYNLYKTALSNETSRYKVDANNVAKLLKAQEDNETKWEIANSTESKTDKNEYLRRYRSKVWR